MRLLRYAACALIATSSLAAVGCSSSSKVENTSTTVGQELEDLEEARNKGLLTEDEYRKQRKRILDRK